MQERFGGFWWVKNRGEQKSRGNAARDGELKRLDSGFSSCFLWSAGCLSVLVGQSLPDFINRRIWQYSNFDDEVRKLISGDYIT